MFATGYVLNYLLAGSSNFLESQMFACQPIGDSRKARCSPFQLLC